MIVQAASRRCFNKTAATMEMVIVMPMTMANTRNAVGVELIFVDCDC
jgi:hypothetical protein